MDLNDLDALIKEIDEGLEIYISADGTEARSLIPAAELFGPWQSRDGPSPSLGKSLPKFPNE